MAATITIQQQSIADPKLFVIDPANTDARLFNTVLFEQGNGGSDRNNVVMAVGYNQSISGTREDLTEPAFSTTFETYYSPTPGTEYMEWYLQYTSAGSVTSRPLMVVVNRNTNTAQWMVSCSSFVIMNSSGATPYFGFGTVLDLHNSAFIRSNVNNAALLSQMNAAGSGQIHIVKLDSSNNINIAPEGTAAIKLSGNALGVFGATPVARDTGWTIPTNLTSRKTFDADTVTVAELADFVGTLSEYLKTMGFIAA